MRTAIDRPRAAVSSASLLVTALPRGADRTAHRLAGRVYVEHLTLKAGNEAVITTEASPVEVRLDAADLIPY